MANKEYLFIIRKTVKNEIEVDKKIVSLLSKEIFIKGETTEDFQNRLYEFLDDCKARKNDEEFKCLIDLFKDALEGRKNKFN